MTPEQIAECERLAEMVVADREHCHADEDRWCDPELLQQWLAATTPEKMLALFAHIHEQDARLARAEVLLRKCVDVEFDTKLGCDIRAFLAEQKG